jgi:hypothetical protein
MKYKLIAAALAAFFMLPLLCGTALAVELDAPTETENTDPAVGELIDNVITGEVPEATYAPDAPITDYPETPPAPFTPEGTGTVIDNATDTDGKQFYTIMTPDEHIFYLVIDLQRETDNVYFLNSVTIADLAALAELPETAIPATVTPTPAAPSEAPAETSPAPGPEQSGGNTGNTGMIVMLAVIVVVGGGAGWYFKIYRPKQQKTVMEEDYSAEEPVSFDDIDPYVATGDEFTWPDELETPEEDYPLDEDEGGGE